MIIKATSRLVEKTKMKINFNYKFKSNTLPCKLKQPFFIKNSFLFKMVNEYKTTLKCTSSAKFKVNKFNCLSFNTVAHKKTEEYNIKNETIIKDIFEFRKISILFMELYNGKNANKKINIKSDSSYILLKYNEDKIESVERFRKMKIEDVITDSLFFALAGL